jgi:3-oxoacyl-[acyl-carrier protein] reductase
MARFSDKVAVVTGASKGIGASIAKRLGVEGASVAVNYASSREGAQRVVDEIVAAGGNAVVVGGSVATEAGIAALFAEVKKQFGRIDVLVNSAGIYELAPLDGISAASFHRQFDTNVLGLLLATQAAVPLFPETGGSIVNISSIVSTAAPPGGSVYSATKGAVDTITLTMAKELAGKKIRVNAVNPGLVITEGTHTAGIVGSDFERGYVAQAPLGRAGQPEDIAAAVAFLASDEASWITGELLHVTGGFGM